MKNYLTFPILLVLLVFTLSSVHVHLNNDQAAKFQDLNTLLIDNSDIPFADDNGKYKVITAAFAIIFVCSGTHILKSFFLYIQAIRRLITINPVFYQSNYVIHPRA